MKKWIFILVTLIAATVLYYGSYYFFKNRNQIGEESETTSEVSEEAGEDENVWGVISIPEVVTKQTTIEMEYYDVVNNRTSYETLKSNIDYLGLDREAVINYTKSYMKHMSVQDQVDGLYDFQLISFSKDKVTLRKCYEKEENGPKYFIGLKEYYVIVYYNDENRTVFEETGIDSRTLPTGVANKLSEGMYFYDDYDLYNFLEAYSS